MLPKKMILGAVMMVMSYFVSPPWLLWVTGGLLTVALMTWKD